MSSSLASPSIQDSQYASSDDVVHNGEQYASSASKNPWDPMILTLDGGGIRGYSSLLILKALMHEVAVWERRLDTEEYGRTAELKDYDENTLLPAHYFDFMYGTSTGGLIATLLGRLRMSVPQCLEIYREVGQTLFGKRRSNVPLTTKYHHRPLERAVKDIVRDHCKQHMAEGGCDGEDYYPWDADVQAKAGVDFDNHICQSICLTAVHNGRIDVAHLLRTYDHRYVDIPNWITPYNEGADELMIWQVARATSAAPFYFDALEVMLRGEKWTMKDGGIRENNPSGCAWNEFISLYGESKNPAMLLSVGTGRPDESQDGFATAWPGPLGHSSLLKKTVQKVAVLRNVLIKYTEGESTHRQLLGTARGEFSWYKRLNVSEGLENLPLDDWKSGPWTDPVTGEKNVKIPGGETLTKMEKATDAYLTRDKHLLYDTYAPPKVMLVQCGEKLVRQRRAREATKAEHTKRWDTYMGRYLTGEFGEIDGPVKHEGKGKDK